MAAAPPTLDPLDPRTLLCERCGYVIEGLDESERCPECAEPIALSLPAQRTGSAWQNGAPGPFEDAAYMIRNPASFFRTLGVHARCDRRLHDLLVLSAALVIGVASSRAGAGPPGGNGVLIWALQAVLIGGVAAITLACLTAIESAGIRFFGRRRGWRITPDVAGAIVAHASIGWVAGAVLFAACVTVEPLRGALGRASDLPAWMPLSWLHVDFAPVVALLMGMLFFEVLVYVGMRQCKHANMPPPPGV